MTDCRHYFILLCFSLLLWFSSANNIQQFATSNGPNPSNSDERHELLRYLQREQTAVLSAQSNLLQKLRSWKIAVGMDEGSLRTDSETDSEDVTKRVIISTKENPIECRVTLDKAPYGSVCVAPCACSGSQKWVQFSVLNKLRRKDPRAWINCPTCRTSYRYDLLFSNSGVNAALIGYGLDNMGTLRILSAIIAAITAHFLGAYAQLSRFVVSKTFWQMYPHWSRITNLPLLIKFWLGKSAVEYLWQKYMFFEKAFVVEFLANMETKLVERSLGYTGDSEKLDDSDTEEDAEENEDSKNDSEDDEE
jgi:hypothetical protein